MSRIIGDALVAGGSLSPDAEAKAGAVDRLVSLVYFYGWPKDRGSRGCVREALEALSPEALRCIEEHGAGDGVQPALLGLRAGDGVMRCERVAVHEPR